MRLPARFHLLAALGALGATGGFALIYALVVWVSRPSKTGGMDPTQSYITWIAVGGLVVALIAVHVVFAQQLRAEDRRSRG